ncbi:D-alanyl-D-alanine carboxypeptidase family protein [Cypionkella sp.]|uniref:D-alanyl-D-alanine carboxypeptidase family protein n=1 Tax=Cypionkella sp. TaxID=2811411 RepID=UPI002FDC8D73
MITAAYGQIGQFVRRFLCLLAVTLTAMLVQAPSAFAAPPYAAFVMDARTGETLYSENADTPLHPASLTKMMTLYIVFGEIEAGRMSLDTMITVSKNAAAQAPSRLGLRAGQKIQLRYLIRAAAVKSANDAAAAMGDAIDGTPERFSARMTRTARALGMKNSTFKNANGLTAKGHKSSAHDMTILGRHLFYDFPQYYNIFSRRSTDAGLATVSSTNRKFLDAYKGADGIKTGYTGPAGFNLTGSAERDGVRIIATVFGGTSTAMRNAKMADLLDLGFRKAKKGAVAVPPTPPRNADNEVVASADTNTDALPSYDGSSAKTLRLVMAVSTSPRPIARPSLEDAADHTETVAAADQAVAAMADDILGALALATAASDQPASAPPARPEDLVADNENPSDTTATESETLQITASAAQAPALKLVSAPRPPKRAMAIYDNAVNVVATDRAATITEVVTNVSTAGVKSYGINVGRFNTHGQAERVLMQTLLSENATLGNSLRKIVQTSRGYDANFLGLSQKEADLACRRLQARGTQCFTMGS